MNIGIIGSGNVGGVLGSRWAAAGHKVVFGTRNPQSEEIQKLVAEAGPNASAALRRVNPVGSCLGAGANALLSFFAASGGTNDPRPPSTPLLPAFCAPGGCCCCGAPKTQLTTGEASKAEGI